MYLVYQNLTWILSKDSTEGSSQYHVAFLAQFHGINVRKGFLKCFLDQNYIQSIHEPVLKFNCRKSNSGQIKNDPILFSRINI